jgi:ribosomal protein S14|tara:strand:- start:8795 stop:9025 length:231 start_codon:yes stop_codon:yes gene_type:complete
MTYSSYKKVFKQLKNKPEKLKKFIKHNAPKKRKHGKSLERCKLCANNRGLITSYKIMLCRRCFRLNAQKIGFKKYY